MNKFAQLQFDWSAPPRAGEASAEAEVSLTPRFAFEQSDVERDVASGVDDQSGRCLSAVAELAERFAALLGACPYTQVDNAVLADLAREVLGSSAGHGRDAYDAAEAGMNLHLARTGVELGDVEQAIGFLRVLQTRLPRQTRRDDTQVELQQFSTPPTEALVVITAAALRADMKVLEPSAGTGNIVVLARMAGAEVDTNEIDERRRSLLSLQGFSPTGFDGERLDNLLPVDRFYDTIVMNPPFSATGGRVRAHSMEFGARHVEQALLRLKPGGRLVASVGRGMALDRPMFRAWWAGIEQRYRVRANLGMDGDVYAKFGTSFDHQIIVIDHDGPTVSESDIITRSGLLLQEAYELLKDLSQEDVYGRVRERAAAAGGASTADDVSARPGPRNGPGARTDRVPAGGRGGRRSPSDGYAGGDGAVADLEPPCGGAPASAGTNDVAGTGTRASGVAAGQGSNVVVGGAGACEHSGPPGDVVGQLEREAKPAVLRIEEGTVFAEYRVQKAIVRGAQPHPAHVVESTAMASVEPPDPAYQHYLPAEVISEGRVSDLQLEDVIYAGQATEVLLPDGSRKGRWNGDGAPHPCAATSRSPGIHVRPADAPAPGRPQWAMVNGASASENPPVY
ncbi:MAG: strawberry notch family protein [Planctomycetota bacterium]